MSFPWKRESNFIFSQEEDGLPLKGYPAHQSGTGGIKTRFMRNFFLYVLKIAYAGIGVVSLVAYWSTVHDLLKKKPSANIASWTIWTTTSGIAFLYSIFILPDILFRIVSGIGFAACGLILVLRLQIK